MHIRTAGRSDLDGIHEVYSCAFPEGEREIVLNISIDLLAENTRPKTFSLVTEIDNRVVAHIAFSPVKFENNENLRGYVLAPLAVLPDYQKKQIGSNLITYGMQTLLEMGVNFLFVYGDPKYYGKFAFNAKDAESFMPQYELQYPFGWQALILNEPSNQSKPCSIVCVATLEDPKLW